jgi:Ca-activated chloride channel homolog
MKTKLGTALFALALFTGACASSDDQEDPGTLVTGGVIGDTPSQNGGARTESDTASPTSGVVVGPGGLGATGGIAGGGGSFVGGGTVGGAAIAGGLAGGAGGTVSGGASAAGPVLSTPQRAADAGAAVPVDPATGVPVKVDATINPFVLVAKDPFSTFAADVDTASYDIFRRSMSTGTLPGATLVRTEEFVNYFDYDYPTPALTDPEPFTISLAATAHVIDSGTHLVRVGIQGAEPTEKKPANLVFLVDVSGSMAAPNKLPLVQVVLREALSVLAPTDTVSVVSYAADTRVRLAPTPVSDRATIEGAINGLAAGGSTNGAAGIQLAYEQASAGFLQAGINHVFLCTDGDFNVGISNTEELVKFIEQKRESGVTLTALGFGDRNNDVMMNRVSNAGNGIYSVIFEQDQAIAYAHQRLLSSMIHIAKDMKLQVEFNPARVRAYRLLGYETRSVADSQFRDDAIDGGEVGAGHRVTALYEIVLMGGELPAAAGQGSAGDEDGADLPREVQASELLRVKVRYKLPGAAADAAAHEVAAGLLPGALVTDPAMADADLRWAVAVASFAELLRGSPYLKNTVLPELRALLEPSQGDEPARREFLTLFDQATKLLVPVTPGS